MDDELIYSEKDDEELNKELMKLQYKAKKLICNDYYDCIHINGIQLSILTQITNAKNHYDINPYLWNSGLMDWVLSEITRKIKEVKKYC